MTATTAAAVPIGLFRREHGGFRHGIELKQRSFDRGKHDAIAKYFYHHHFPVNNTRSAMRILLTNLRCIFRLFGA